MLGPNCRFLFLSISGFATRPDNVPNICVEHTANNLALLGFPALSIPPPKLVPPIGGLRISTARWDTARQFKARQKFKILILRNERMNFNLGVGSGASSSASENTLAVLKNYDIRNIATGGKLPLGHDRVSKHLRLATEMTAGAWAASDSAPRSSHFPKCTEKGSIAGDSDRRD